MLDFSNADTNSHTREVEFPEIAKIRCLLRAKKYLLSPMVPKVHVNLSGNELHSNLQDIKLKAEEIMYNNLTGKNVVTEQVFVTPAEEDALNKASKKVSENSKRK